MRADSSLHHAIAWLSEPEKIAFIAGAQAFAYAHFRDNLHVVAAFFADAAQPFAFVYLLMQIFNWLERRLRKPEPEKIDGD
jgi:hypothetical protein